MAATDAAGGLRAWSLATFRTTSFMASMILWLHLRGTLGAFLKRLDTSIGFAAFVAFWVATWIATRIGLRMAGDAIADRAPSDAVLPSTIVAGGWNGVFVFGILVVGVLFTFVQAQGASALAAAPVFLFAVPLGGLLAFTTGGVVGLAYGLVDTVVRPIGRALHGWAARGLEPSVPPRTSVDSPRS